MSPFNNPFLLGFDQIERLLDRATKGAGDSYPPYNIEKMARDGNGAEVLRITLAVAGFTLDELEIKLEDAQLSIRGRQNDDETREFLHRGIAARQFQRNFVLAESIEVKSAELQNGLLSIELECPVPEHLIRMIEITERD